MSRGPRWKRPPRARLRNLEIGCALVQPELAFDKAEFGGRDQPPVRHANAVERAVEIGVPEAEEIGELGKARGEIVILPDIALQEPRIVRQTVEDLRGCQREAVDLAKEGAVHRLIVPALSFLVFSKKLAARPSRVQNFC